MITVAFIRLKTDWACVILALLLLHKIRVRISVRFCRLPENKEVEGYLALEQEDITKTPYYSFYPYLKYLHLLGRDFVGNALRSTLIWNLCTTTRASKWHLKLR